LISEQKKNQLIENIPCIKPSDVNEKIEQVIIGVFNRDVSPVEISTLLKSKKVNKIIGYHEINKILHGVVQPSFWYNPDSQLLGYQESIQQLKSYLADKHSIDVLENVIQYRLTVSISDHIDGDGLNKQYFKTEIENWLSKKEITMIDCGAYIGDTLMYANQLEVSIKKAYCFEPDLFNFEKLVNYVKSQNIECVLIPCASWSRDEIIYFDNSASESSRVVDEVGVPVQAITIDSFSANLDYNFLKIDVEGADLDTLMGAINSIKKNRPYIAVALYHRPNDLWEIPLFLISNITDYKFYIRQHGHNLIETVLYCVPLDRNLR